MLSYATAFICCGILCAAAQAIHIFFRASPPVILNLYLAAGGLFTPCGLMEGLSSFGGGGFLMVICGAGNAFEQGAEAAMAGEPTMLFLVVAMFLIVIFCGMLAGELRYHIESDAVAHQST